MEAMTEPLGLAVLVVSTHLQSSCDNTTYEKRESLPYYSSLYFSFRKLGSDPKKEYAHGKKAKNA